MRNSLHAPTSRSLRSDDIWTYLNDRSRKQQQLQRGILKKPKDDAHRSPAKLKETPEQWFQRVMKTKKLSPLDLCDLFSFGDARKHPRVPLSHVCEVLFDLDPEVLNSRHDPVTPEMEEFLYQFSFEGDDDKSESEIVVNVKDALRSLNIWQSGVTSLVKTKGSGSTITSSSTESESSVKSIVLEAKSKKLQGVISSLQDANLRRSQRLDDAAKSSKASEPTSDFKTKAQQKQQGRQRPFSTSSLLKSSVFISSSWLSNSELSAASTSSVNSSKPALKSSIVNHHEDELIKIANLLQYHARISKPSSGVKQLEELLIKSDKPASNSNPSALSGFVSLKQLRWLLAEHFDIAISETSLMESCLGMNFNAQAQLDYHEFVSVLLDILLYAIPKASSFKRQQLYDKILQYLDSGFQPSQSSRTSHKNHRHHHHQMLAALCEKYDLEGDHLILVSEMMRVFYKDLETHHAMDFDFPLSQEDVLQILQPFIKESSHQDGGSSGESGFLNYPEFLDSLFNITGSDGGNEEVNGDTGLAIAKRALDWDFWVKLRKALCSGNLALEPQIHAQMCKIFKKIDLKRQFLVSKRNFCRILDQHLSGDDLDTLASALAQSDRDGGANEIKSSSQKDRYRDASSNLRFDVFMKLVFGAPALQDTKYLGQQIVHKLVLNEVAIRKNIIESMKKHGGGYEITIAGLYQLLVQLDSSTSNTETKPHLLTMTELLYLFGYLDSGHEGFIELKTLWTVLKDDCWAAANRKSNSSRSRQSGNPCKHNSSRSGDHSTMLSKTKTVLAQCLNAYNLERALSEYGREKKQQHGETISQDQLLKEIYKMLKALGRDANDDDAMDLANLQQLISNIAIQVHGADPELVNMGKLHLPIPIHAFFEALFDWESMIKALRLPQNLMEVKKVFELFDWSKDGSIPIQDWNKAWRQICGKEMAEWETRVLERRFTAGSQQEHRHFRAKRGKAEATGPSSSIDYARLLVHLMDTQHQNARTRLKKLVLNHFRQKCAEMTITSKSGTGVGMHQIDRLFQQIDAENRGQFNMRDLQQYLFRIFDDSEEKKNSASDSDEDEGDAALVQNVNVMGYVLSYIADRHQNLGVGAVVDHQRARATTVTRTRFQDFLQSLMAGSSSPKRGKIGRTGGDGAQDGWATSRSSRRPQHERDDPGSLSPHKKTQTQVLTSLRALELVILDICSDITSENGRIQPTRAFRYFSEGVIIDHVSHSRSRSRSPTRSASSSQSPTRRNPRSSSPYSMSMIAKSQHREVEAMALDPITPAKLKHVLLEDHALQVSSHIVSQFFLHIGSRSKYFLELLEFAKWVAPLSLEMQCEVRESVKKMIVRSKGGGGQVDLDRFLGQLHRKLLDSPPYASLNSGGGADELLVVPGDLCFVSPSLLQTKLNQLGVLLSRLDMEMPLRHFGMEEDVEVDFALFLQRIVELNANLTPIT